MTPFSLRCKKALNTRDPRMTLSGQAAGEGIVEMHESFVVAVPTLHTWALLTWCTIHDRGDARYLAVSGTPDCVGGSFLPGLTILWVAPLA